MLIKHFFQDEDNRYWIDCRINSLHRLVSFYGIEISRNYVFLLSEAYSFYYLYIDFKNSMISRLPFVATSESRLEKTLFQSLNIQSVTERLDNSTASFERLKDFIRLQKPILLHAIEHVFIGHTAVLDKLKVNIRMQSIPILIGIDEDENYILYWFSSGQRYSENPIVVQSRKEMDFLRSIECAPYPPDFQCTYITNSILPLSKEFIIQRLHEAVKSITKKMLCGFNIDSIAIKNLDATESYSGLKAMKKMNADLHTMFSVMQLHPEDIDYKKRCYLSCLLFRVFLFKASISSFRQEFGAALCQLSDEISDTILSDIGRDFLSVSRNWKKIFIILGRMKASSFCVEQIAEVCETFNTIYEQERLGFRKLAKYYGLMEEPS